MKRLPSQTELAELLVILYILTILVQVVFVRLSITSDFIFLFPSLTGRYSSIQIQFSMLL